MIMTSHDWLWVTILVVGLVLVLWLLPHPW